ncbi:MAG: UDP-N-acetylmuramate--L-alanine ligase [Bacteroidales bacterium]|nr:UDP-N-acetylmuramate--L-alanine ligase [Bacteroidales bacterium]
MDSVESLIADDYRRKTLEENILKLAKPDAGKEIADECLKLCKGKDFSAKASEPKNVYFIGIGGIGMSALARYYKSRGCNVSGYDRTPSPLTKALESEGIAVHYEDNPGFIPQDKDNTLVIYTPAIPADMQELVTVNAKGYKVIKRSRALGHIAEGKTCLAISGSHGKTTTSTLLAHIFQDSGKGCNAFLGGISRNYDSNLLLAKNNTVVAEADEFDRSFHQLFPHIAVVTATDPDHLDIYGTVENMREAYAKFASQVDADGYLIVKKGAILDTSKVRAKVLSYAFKAGEGKAPDFYASDIEPIKKDGKETGMFRFTLNCPPGIGNVEGCTVGVPGWVNIENAVAASSVALLAGIDKESLKKALASFRGVQRRMDIHVNTPKVVYIDDYAHHPQEIATTISSLREAFPDRKLTAVFQPHLYTRTRDLADGFSQALSTADSVILLDIYPARELPIEGVSSELIFNKMNLSDKMLITKEELLDTIKNRLEEGKIDLLVTFGAGNIDRFVEPLEKMLK